MSVRHVPFWLDRVPKTKRPASARLRGAARTTVVIVGGGLTGCACAWSFAAAGVKTILLEAEALGGGATAGGAGIIREDVDASFLATSADVGVRAARALWSGMRRASLDFPAGLRRLNARCDLEDLDLLQVGRRDEASARRLRREYQSRRDAGFEPTWVTPAGVSRAAAIESGGAIRTRGAGLDPYRACLALARAAEARGAELYERSPVQRIRHTRSSVEVTTTSGSVSADTVVVATGAPIPDLRALRRHLEPRTGYAVVTEPLPAAVRREVGTRNAALRDAADPPHVLRWLPDDRVLFTGADQRSVPDRARDRTLVQRTGQLMYELSMIYPAISGLQPEWSWDVAYYDTVDGLPFIGPHRNFPRHLFAIGGIGHGAGLAWAAARILLRCFQRESAKGDEAFGFARVLGTR